MLSFQSHYSLCVTLVISGYSGCGKTTLVNSIFESVEATGGYVISKKFDAIPSTSPLSVVISAFNDLCLQLARRSSPQELHIIYQSLLTEFGVNFHMLASALPNVASMLSSGGSAPVTVKDANNLANYSSLCFTIQSFMRVVSSTDRPVVMFLDDLQWGDRTS